MGQTRKTSNFEHILRRIGACSVVFLLAFTVALLSASVLTPIDNSEAATSVHTAIRNAGTYARITAPSEMVLNLESTSDGTAVFGSQVVTAATNAEHGYRLFISTGSTDVNSKMMVKNDGNIADAIANHYYLSAISGTSVLSSAPANSWGYAMAGQNGNSDTISVNSTFVGMPLRGSDNLIRTVTDATSDGSGNITDSSKANTTVYYGAKANTALPTGIYTATVTYTAIIESNSSTISVVPYAIPQLAAGYEVTVATPTAAEQGMNIGTPTITVRPAGATSGGTTVNCTRKTVDDSIFVTLSCELPAEDFVGEYDVIANVSGSSYTASNAILHYVPWDKLQYMQDMTTYTCDEIDTPSAFNDGGSSPVYNYGPISSSNNTVKTDSTLNLTNDWPTATSANYASFGRIANINTGVPEKNLVDVRDGNSYRVRKLADGNCWMTENLRLAFSDDSATIGYLNASGTISAKGAATYTRSFDGSIITVPANHTIEEALSNVGKNAVGGSSDWTSEKNSSFGYTEIINTGATATNSLWGSETRGKHPSSGTVGWDENHSNISMDYARSLYNGETHNDCTRADVIGTNNCFIKNGDTQTVGTYYNWKAATAGVGDLTNTSRNDSICPSGWQLPINSGNKSYQKLINEIYSANEFSGNNDAFNSDSSIAKTLRGYHVWAMAAQMRMAPVSLSFSGYYYWGGTLHSVGEVEFLWSGTPKDTRYMYLLDLRAGYLGPQAGNLKGYGYTIRCVSQ